jgi:hypothetical protein
MLLVRSDVIGRTMKDRDGQVVGTVTDFYPYPAGSGPYWGAAEVATGHHVLRLRATRCVVDLTNAQFDTPAIVVAHTLATIRCAPRLRLERALTTAQANSLIAHYWPASGNRSASR